MLHGNGDFGTLDAVNAYHERFPHLYRLLPDTSIYTYMPLTQYYNASKCVDMKRLGYAGNFWGHGPGHDKGDEIGNPDWWDNPEFFDVGNYNYTRRIERMWGSVFNLRERIGYFFRQSYDNFYTIRRFHTCPDLTPTYIMNKIWPGYVPNEDPLTMGQYYTTQWGYNIVNEYNTPLGFHFRENMRRFLYETKGYCPGFINDMSHAGSLYRHNDPIAQHTPGRAFARDLGAFVRKAAGRRQRYEDLMGFMVNSNRLTYWSDGGSFSYTIGAYSAGIAIEGAGMYKDLTGSGDYVVPARFLVGEKPFGAMTHLNDDWIGYYLEPDMFTPATLRDYYRYCGRQLVLFCLKNGVTLDPGSYMFGRQAELELAPIMVESTARGRRLVPAASIDEPLWVVRSGRDFDTLFVVGNEQPAAQASALAIHRRYFPQGAPLVMDWFGQETAQRVTADRVTVPVNVAPRDIAALKPVAFLETAGPAAAAATLSGDGLALSLDITLTLETDAELLLNTFAPIYHLAEITIDGTPAAIITGEPFPISAGRHVVAAVCRQQTLDFDAATWAQVDLLKDGQNNVLLVSDPGVRYEIGENDPSAFRIGFERGTASLFNEFLQQYDAEDGILGNLSEANVVRERPADYAGWSIELLQTPEAPGGRVRIDAAAHRIFVEAMTQGHMRRAMVVFMRLVDRKYPHIGRFHELRDRKAAFDPETGVPFDKWIIRKATRDFFEAFPDRHFWAKPILAPEYESLYADGNMDFAGKYTLRRAPFLYEPTFDETYVYGYSGLGKAFTRPELQRQARPEETAAQN